MWAKSRGLNTFQMHCTCILVFFNSHRSSCVAFILTFIFYSIFSMIITALLGKSSQGKNFTVTPVVSCVYVANRRWNLNSWSIQLLYPNKASHPVCVCVFYSDSVTLCFYRHNLSLCTKCTRSVRHMEKQHTLETLNVKIKKARCFLVLKLHSLIAAASWARKTQETST
jgi:hypothetical protein